MDDATLHFTDALVNVVCGLTCLSLWLNQRRDRCLAFWGTGLLIYGTTNSLFPFTPDTPLWNSVGFTVLNIANFIMWGGYRLFDGRLALTPAMRVLLPVPVVVCVLAALSLGDWSSAERMALVVYSGLGIAQVSYVLRGRLTWTGPRTISGMVVLLNIVVILVTAFAGGRWFSIEFGRAAFLLTDHVVTIVFTLAVLAMVGERDYRTIRDTAHHDLLTGTLNRSGLADAIEQGAVARALLLIDLDFFKQINDRYGHAGGDAALRTFASSLRALLMPSDLLVRLGGEEFLIVTDMTSTDAAKALAERVRASAGSARLQIGAAEVRFTVSIGVSIRVADEDLDEAIKRADAALYHAKAAGRNRVECASTVARSVEYADLTRRLVADHPATKHGRTMLRRTAL
ncbi:GGDEF domain-containing protein [Sphingomonas sp. Mn802worker]|uniref:GGDEF domain-containing protein n=1 Tax=Sphingomonas sp. Mn802worker TaxID=629773 RepID=UPI00037E165F|nr:GGDEF domain-containing protein [Sphingomonas sp. Mn802worker]